MTPQEKMNQLAAAALRAAPPAGSAPKPATYMAPFGKPTEKEVKPVAKAPEAAPVAAPEAEQTETTVTATQHADAPAKAFIDKPDAELRAMIEDREEKIGKKLGRQSLAVTLSLLGLLAAGGVWYAVSPGAQASVAKLVPALKQSVNDAKMIGSITSQYDESLEKISVHGKRIDDATASLGIDPTSVSKEDNLSMDDEMGKMMGEGAVTTGDRDKLLQQKFGFVEKLMGKRAGGDEAPAMNP
ncbi:hypothetical protein [Luteolibacter marinus]|uniref:hypothetical protein n=1 Tax=Luteolibacter marinus TaxID=2776705 RepID=UPI0018690184|nr:hypothetical protein [Luteolibacter marinus]